MLDQGWSFPVGAFLGIQWRVHLLLPMSLATALAGGWVLQRTVGNQDLFLLTLQLMGVAVVSLFLQELGQGLIAYRLGLPPHEVLLGPLGNMLPRPAGPSPIHDFYVAFTSPLVHFTLAIFAISTAGFYGGTPSLTWLNPVTPPELNGSWQIAELASVMWVVNWSFALIQLLPMQPLDGHSMAVSGIRLLQPSIPVVWAGLLVRHVGLLLGALLLGLGIGAFLWSRSQGLLPDWVVPIAISALLVWAATGELAFGTRIDPVPATNKGGNAPSRTHHQASPKTRAAERAEDEEFLEQLERDNDEDFSPSEELEDEAPTPQMLDSILQKLHEQGSSSLTEREKELLKRASDDFRRRRG